MCWAGLERQHLILNSSTCKRNLLWIPLPLIWYYSTYKRNMLWIQLVQNLRRWHGRICFGFVWSHICVFDMEGQHLGSTPSGLLGHDICLMYFGFLLTAVLNICDVHVNKMNHWHEALTKLTVLHSVSILKTEDKYITDYKQSVHKPPV